MARIFLVSASLLVAFVLWLVRRPTEESLTVPARELVVLAQEHLHANFTFDHATSRALDENRVPRPQEPVRADVLAQALAGIGLEVVLLPIERDEVYLIRSAGG